MLTIQNINKLEHKTLGKKNFYVERVEQKFDMDGAMFTTKNHKYIFELSNRKYAITVTLNREAEGEDELKYEYKLRSSNGNILYINISDIRNLDKFLDKLRYVALG
jgi:hypothetical protein